MGFVCSLPAFTPIYLVTRNPEDMRPLTEEIAFLGDGTNRAEDDVAYVRAEDGTVFKIDVPATAATSATANCEAAEQASGLRLLPRAVSLTPLLIAPIAGHQVIWVDEQQRLRRGKAMDGTLADVVLFELDPLAQGDIAFDPAGGAYDADGAIYMVDTDGVMRKIQVITGTLRKSWTLPQWTSGMTALSDAPMVFGRMVYLPLNDGRLMGLEEGGVQPPHGAAWSRASGSHFGPMYLGCHGGGQSTWLSLLGLLALHRWRRRSMPLGR
jgi:hypothetical protein